MPIARRHFLLAAVYSAAACALSLLKAGASYDDPRGSAPTEPHVLVAQLGPDTVRRIGARYRSLVPAEDDARILQAQLATRAPRSITDDFTADRTVVVDGWLLSVTEARQCALFSLLG